MIIIIHLNIKNDQKKYFLGRLIRSKNVKKSMESKF